MTHTMTARATAALLDGASINHGINQVDDPTDVDAFDGDAVASFSLLHYGGGWAADRARALAATAWSAETQQNVRLSHRNLPELRTVDRLGRRLDQVEFHPAYHQLMISAFQAGVHSLPFSTNEPGGHLARAVLSYLWNEADGGTSCPTGMTYAAIPILEGAAGLDGWSVRARALDYDPRVTPVDSKTAVTVGFAMTEKQGGSDLRSNETIASPESGRGGTGEAYLLTGHKWFFSAPMSDGFFTIAATDAGPSCFFVPRFLPDGSRNSYQLQRLKDKLGNRNNASSEVEFRRTWAVLIGDEGRGIRTILESAHLTRLDFAIGSAGLMRAALTQALHHANNRQAFGSPLVELPGMSEVLADLVLEWASAAHLAFRMAATGDSDEEGERLLGRLLTPVAKYWVCKRAPSVVSEAMECLGGNGYIEEHVLPRYYREAPLNAIWEGTSNMMVADVQRVVEREPKALEPFFDEVRAAEGANPHLDRAIAALTAAATGDGLVTGRRLVSTMALTLQASLLTQHAPAVVAEAFCASRLGSDWAPTFGTLPANSDTKAIVEYGQLR